MSDDVTRVEFSLPFLIALDDGLYPVRIGADTINVELQRIQRREGSGGWQIVSGAAEIPYDTRGQFAYTHVAVNLLGFPAGIEDPISYLPDSITRIDKFFDAPRFTILERALEILNRLIDVVRQETADFSLKRARYADLVDFNITLLRDGKRVGGIAGMSTGNRGLRLSTGPIQYLSIDQRADLLTKLKSDLEVDIGRSFMLDAKWAFLHEEYALATVLSVIAIEVELSRVATVRGAVKGIKERDIMRMVREIGIKSSLESFLKLILEKGDSSPDSEVVSSCMGTIAIRNKIVHEGLRTLSRDETANRIMAAEKLTTYLHGL